MTATLEFHRMLYRHPARRLTEIHVFDDVVDVILDRLSELGWTRGELAARAV